MKYSDDHSNVGTGYVVDHDDDDGDDGDGLVGEIASRTCHELDWPGRKKRPKAVSTLSIHQWQSGRVRVMQQQAKQ